MFLISSLSRIKLLVSVCFAVLLFVSIAGSAAAQYGSGAFGSGPFGTETVTSSGGGGGGASVKDDIEINTVIPYSTLVEIDGSVNDDASNLVAIVSSEDQTLNCTDADKSGYFTNTIPGTYEDGDDFSVTVSGLSPDTIYYLIICAEVDDDEEASDQESFTTTEVDNAAPVLTTDAAGVAAPAIQTKIPAGFSFKNNVSFIQPSVNDATDVRYIAQFLNEFEGENLAVDAVHDAADDAAVKRFQEKYRKEVLDIWNLDAATGYVGITTRLKMNFLLKGQTAQCPVFTEFNGGLNGIFQSEEVRKTQEILMELDLFAGPVTGYWDPFTHEALVDFQELFREVMLDPWNITKGTGYKYKTTNKFLNYFAGCDTGAVELEGVGNFDF